MRCTIFLSTYRNTTIRCIMRAALYSKNCTRYFFQRDTSSESNYNRSCPGQPYDWKLVDCCNVYIYIQHVSFRYPPIPTFIWVSIVHSFCANYDFLFKIDHDQRKKNCFCKVLNLPRAHDWNHVWTQNLKKHFEEVKTTMVETWWHMNRHKHRRSQNDRWMMRLKAI